MRSFLASSKIEGAYTTLIFHEARSARCEKWSGTDYPWFVPALLTVCVAPQRPHKLQATNS